MEKIIKTGFNEFDYLTKGLHGGELILIGGRAGMGKTTVALSLVRNIVLKENIPVAYFSLELSKSQLINRINSHPKKVTENFIVDDTPAITVEVVCEKCLKLKEEENIGLIIIDYFQLLEGAIRKGSELLMKLKELARVINVPIIVTSQLSRNVENRKNHRPKLIDLEKMGVIEQYVDTIIFLYRDDYYDHHSERRGIIELNIVKQRNDKVGTFEMAFIGEYCAVANLSWDIKCYEIKLDEVETNQIRRFYFNKGYDLVDEVVEDIEGEKIRKCYFIKEENGIWTTTCVAMKYLDKE